MRRAARGIVGLGCDDAELALARRLSRNLRDLILGGLWAHGEKVPGTRLIAKDAGVSRWTAVVAIDLLAAEGLVETRNRSGTYVSWTGAPAEPRVDHKAASAPPLPMPFTIGTPALDVFPLNVWRRIQTKRWQSIPLDALQTGPSAGWPGLRAAIAVHLAATRGIKCAPEQIIVAPSMHACLLIASECLCSPGSAAWIEEPCHPGTRPALTAAGLSPVAVPVDEEGLRVADGRRLAPRAAMAVVTASRQFPTGAALSARRRRALLDWSRDTGAFIIEDDFGCEFASNRASAALAAMPDAAHVVYMNSFSATVFPSLRLSYLVVPASLVARFGPALQRAEPAVPNQIVLADFITSGEFAKHLRHSREVVAERREALIAALSEYCGAHLSTEVTDCGMHLLARFRYAADDAAVAAGARGAGLTVDALSDFCRGDTRQSGLLLGYAAFHPAQLREATMRLADVLATQAARHPVAWVS